MSILAQGDDGITGHTLLVAAPAHGHWPTLFVFAVKLVQQRPGTAVTILALGDYFTKINQALDRYFDGENVKLKEHIRVIRTGGEGLAVAELMPIAFQSFGEYYTPLLSSSDVVCQTGKTYPGIRPPTAVIVDFFFLGILQIIRSISGTKIPVYAWFSATTATMIRFGPKANSGYYGDVAAEAPVLAKKLNKSVQEVSLEMYFPSKSEAITIPGLPTVYDYELVAEWESVSDPAAAAHHLQVGLSIHQIIQECDGALTASDDVLEPESNEALRAWFSEMNKKVYVLGPLVPKEHETSTSEVSAFLSRMQEITGEHSVLYVSTGTFFSPQGPGLAKILEVVLDMGIPLIYSTASRAKLPADLVERLARSDRVYTSPWIPQRAVLAHPATGCFLTHGGQNSLSEAISACVPLIVYPITVDQPIGAVYVSLKLKIGYELLEIRTGKALRPAYRGANPTGTLEAIEKEIRDVLGKAFGPDGEEKRNNMRLLRDKRNALWEDGGAAKEELLRFIRENCS